MINSISRILDLAGGLEPGTVSLVGAGPGDSALITVRGAVRLAQADVVLHDKLIGPELLELVRPEAERVFVGKWPSRDHFQACDLPATAFQPELAHRMPGDGTRSVPATEGDGTRSVPATEGDGTRSVPAASWTQDEINEALVAHARAGKRVVRLKGGDPFVFGRGGEECEHLAAAGVRFEVVPGVTAAFGAPAMAGIPLTHRGLSRSVVLVSGSLEGAIFNPLTWVRCSVPGGEHAGREEEVERSKEAEGQKGRIDYAALARMDTIAMYMGMKHLEVHCRGLMAAGLGGGTPAAVIHWGTRPQQKTVVGTLSDIAGRVAGADIRPPAMVLIGQVVGLRDRIEWFEHRPLHGQTILVTRMRHQSAALSGPLRAAGADVLEAPTIELAPVDDWGPVDDVLSQLPSFNWLVLTSVNGVDAMFERLRTLGRDVRALGGLKVAAIGSATAARLRARGIEADLVPADAVGESVAEALIADGIQDRQVLLLRGDLARERLPEMLRAAGGMCVDLPVYRTVCAEALPQAVLERLDQGEIDWITLTSPSSFANLMTLLGDDRSTLLHRIRLASIGPVTTRAIVEAGHQVAAEADPHDVPGLVQAITRTVSGGRRTG